MDIEQLSLRIGLALAIGFVIGLERGWRERSEKEGSRTAGIRTYSLIGLLGGILGAISLQGDRILLGAAFVTLGAALAAYMWREGERHKDLSATSLVAALLTFALGAFAVLGDSAAAAGAGVVTVILLASKKSLHGWLARITWIELQSGLLLAAMTFIALPLLPNRPIDPWDALNPHDLWLMTILIATVSFAGYAAVKLAGPRRGLTLAAALGGLFASTAVTLSLARLAKGNSAHVKLLGGSILAAGCVMLLRVLVVAGLINRPLAVLLAPTLMTAAAVSAVIAYLLVQSGRDVKAHDGKGLDLKNPFDLGEVLRFGLLLTAVMLAVVFARQYFGDAGLLGLAALSGLADVDAMTISAARLDSTGTIAANAILLAIAVNSLAKSIYAWYAGGSRIGLWMLAVTLIAATAAGAVWWRTIGLAASGG
ncbi:MAG: MgtC/SapB family protein [Alphaproteobacteria bacterium]|nr:MgtC/SapB family protein [Alphaproteobacteria bacterium]